MKIVKVVVMVLVLSAGAVKVFAAYPLTTDDAPTVKKHSFELEASYDNCRDEHELKNQQFGASLKYGITEQIDAGIVLPYQIDPFEDEWWGGASAIVKVSVIKDRVALTATHELNEKDYFINAIYTKEFPAIRLCFNAGYLSAGDETANGSGTYGVSAEIPVKKFEAVGEVQGQEGGVGYFLAGLRYRFSDVFFIAFGASRAFESNADRLTVGFHYEF